MELKRRLADGTATHGVAIIAASQTAGRGRGDHLWHSPPGGLYFSLLLNSFPNRRPTDLVFLAGVALAETALHFGARPQDLILKWPNDLLLKRHKVAGILAELEGPESVILGVGVNLSTPKTEWKGLSAKFPAASLADFGVPTETRTFGAELHRRVMGHYGIYQAKGFEEVRRLWLKHCGLVGQKLEVATDEAAPPLTGIFIGIDPVGSLMLRDHSGKDHTLNSAEILCCLS